MKRIKRMVAKAKVMTAFFMPLHVCIVRDVKNVRKTMNSRKISVLLKMVRNIHLNRLEIIVPVEVIKDFGKLEIYFEEGIKNLKRLQKIIKRIINDLKVSAENILKNLRRLENFMIRFKNICLKLLTVAERSI